MKIIKNNSYELILSDGSHALRDCVLALGNFDGVHIAHATLLDKAKELRAGIGASQVGVWCFGQNPMEFFSHTPPQGILTKEEKIKIFFECGMDFVVIGDFTEFRNTDATDFVKDHLIGELSCVGAVCGYNFKFGKGRTGEPALLRDIFGEDRCLVVDRIQLDGVTVSSTKIRELILSGDMGSARKFLGRPYYISSTVTQGKRLGRTLGFPTTNQYFPENHILPKRGIYATVCTTEDGKRYIGVSNVGIRPTITDGTDTHRINCETYIVDFEGDVYGQSLKVEFYKLLRDERKFNSVDELKSAIGRDAAAAVTFFDNMEVGL